MSQKVQIQYKFGDWIVEPHLNRLSSESEARQIEPLAMDVLCCLLARHGQVVTTDEVLDRVWATGGEPSMVAKRVNQIRRALGDDAKHPDYVQTIPKRGYRTIARVLPIAQAVHRDPSEADEPAGPTPPPVAAVGAAAPRQTPNRRYTIALATVAALATLASLAWTWTGPGGDYAARPIRTIAVLPLENLSGDPAQDYIADGMTEELITELAKLPGLQVISRTSAMHYKGARPSLQAVVEELGVDGIVEGTVTHELGRFRVTVQLIDARNDTHLWADRFDSEDSSVLRLRSDVAREVARRLQLDLSADQTDQMETPREVDSAAYDAYLRGLARLGLPADVEQWAPLATEEFERALELDSDLAEAHAWLALLKLRRAVFNSDYFPRVRRSAEDALAIDDRLGPAHAVLGFVSYIHERDLDGADRAFKSAIRLSPNNPSVLNLYQIYLRVEERQSEAMEISDRLLRVAPRDAYWRATRIDHLYHLRLYERVIVEAEDLRRLVPGYADRNEAAAYHRLGRFKDGHSARMDFYRLCGAPCEAALKAADRAWEEGEYERALLTSAERLLDSEQAEVVLSAQVAETPYAFAWLEAAVEEREVWLIGMRSHPDYDPMRLDPRFDQALDRMDLRALSESPARMADVGRLLAFRGRPAEAVTRLERAMAESPDDPRFARWLESLAWAHFSAGDYAQATDWARRVLERDVSPHAAAFAHLLSASSDAHLGRDEEANAHLDLALESWPTTLVPDRDLRPLFLGGDPALHDRYFDGLREAGLGN